MPAGDINIAAIRREYTMAALDEKSVGEDPMFFFGRWLAEAEAAQIHEVNAMTLATCDEDNKPHARIVLLKGLDEGFVFFTNYNSAKGTELSKQTDAALVFFWKELERQVRVEGTVSKISEKESNDYFYSRPENSQLGAWASPQSKVIANREVLDANYRAFEQKFQGKKIERPPYWGGYRVIPEQIEFWQGRSSRMHDRIVFVKNEDNWSKMRLAP